MVNLAVWSFCKNRALPLRGGDFGMPDGACVRLDGSDAATVLRAPRGVVYILRSVPTVTYQPILHEAVFLSGMWLQRHAAYVCIPCIHQYGTRYCASGPEPVVLEMCDLDE